MKHQVVFDRWRDFNWRIRETFEALHGVSCKYNEKTDNFDCLFTGEKDKFYSISDLFKGKEAPPPDVLLIENISAIQELREIEIIPFKDDVLFLLAPFNRPCKIVERRPSKDKKNVVIRILCGPEPLEEWELE